MVSVDLRASNKVLKGFGVDAEHNDGSDDGSFGQFYNIHSAFTPSKVLALNLYFTNKYYVQLYKYTQQEVMPQILWVCSTPCTSKISLNLLTQKLLIEHWWNWCLWSISSIFYEELLRQSFCPTKLQSQTVTREKLHKALSVKNGLSKMLMKLTPAELKFSLPSSMLLFTS